MLCKDVMLTLVYKCTRETSVYECAKMMRDEKIGFVPVIDSSRKVVGVVTDRDIAVRMVAANRPGSMPVSEIMSTGPFLSCAPDDDLRALERKMAQMKRSRALVKDEAGELVGVISLADIAQFERSPTQIGRLMREVGRRESVAITRIVV